jgi:hypothetical protein
VLTRLWPTFFAYQFVAEAEVRSLEASRGEGLIFGQEANVPSEDFGEFASLDLDEEPDTTPRRILVRAGHIRDVVTAGAAEGCRPRSSFGEEE